METPGFFLVHGKKYIYKKQKWAIKRNLKIFYVKIDYKKINYVLKNRKEKYINRKENERKFSISIDLGEENIDLPNRYKRGKKPGRKTYTQGVIYG